MKKILMLLAVLMLTGTASAQFEADKKYVGASLTGLSLGYNGASEFRLGAAAQGGYMVDDNLMLLGELAYDNHGKNVPDVFVAGVGGRYYIEQNGVFLGANCKYKHAKSYNDFMPGIEVGYAFFLSRTVTIEPSLYYQQSLKKHSDYSTIGLKIGIGIYLE